MDKKIKVLEELFKTLKMLEEKVGTHTEDFSRILEETKELYHEIEPSEISKMNPKIVDKNHSVWKLIIE